MLVLLKYNFLTVTGDAEAITINIIKAASKKYKIASFIAVLFPSETNETEY